MKDILTKILSHFSKNTLILIVLSLGAYVITDKLKDINEGQDKRQAETTSKQLEILNNQIDFKNDIQEIKIDNKDQNLRLITVEQTISIIAKKQDQVTIDQIAQSQELLNRLNKVTIDTEPEPEIVRIEIPERIDNKSLLLNNEIADISITEDTNPKKSIFHRIIK